MVKILKTQIDTEVEKRLVGIERKLSHLEEKATDQQLETIHLGNKVTNVDNSLIRIKDEILTMKDEVMGELKAIREEQTILSSQHGRILDIEDQVEKLEKIHPKFTHTAI